MTVFPNPPAKQRRGTTTLNVYDILSAVNQREVNGSVAGVVTPSMREHGGEPQGAALVITILELPQA